MFTISPRDISRHLAESLLILLSHPAVQSKVNPLLDSISSHMVFTSVMIRITPVHKRENKYLFSLPPSKPTMWLVPIEQEPCYNLFFLSFCPVDLEPWIKAFLHLRSQWFFLTLQRASKVSYAEAQFLRAMLIAGSKAPGGPAQPPRKSLWHWMLGFSIHSVLFVGVSRI